MYDVGLQIGTCSVWPEALTTLQQVLLAMDDACRANAQSTPLGYYKAHPLGAQAMRVVCYTPTPGAFEYGLVTGVARKYKPARSLHVRVEPEPVPADFLPILK